MTAQPLDVVAYTYAADLWCPEHIIEALPMGESQAFDGWAVSDEDSMTTEENLNELAAAFGIARDEEWAFDSDYFPKVVLRDQLKDDEGCAGAEHTCQNLGPQCNGCDMDPYVPSVNQHYGDCPLAAPMGEAVDEDFDARHQMVLIEAEIIKARAALGAEHEGNFKAALTRMAELSANLHQIVESW